jgi:hypothetical protein
MTLDPRYLVATDLNPYLADKSAGTPLAGGTLEFWKDNDRNVPKTVYQLTGSPPNYTYSALPNPVTLSATGTIEDDNGANCALYYFPFDSTGAGANIELYYIVCKNAEGTIQFTREAWPNTTPETNPVTSQNNTIINQLSNPQFADILFESPLTINVTGATTTTVEIAPSWSLAITHTGASTVDVTRTAVAGSAQYPTNPPYVISFTAGTDITALKLYQRLSSNPDIWSRASGGDDGYIATNIVLASGSAVTIQYDPSVGTPQTLLSEANATGNYEEYSDTVQLNAAANNDTGADGYVDIVINLSASGTTSLTSVQVVGLDSNDEGVLYAQAPVNRQLDQLFHYYNPLLQAKQIASYLVGWDFPVNPAQILGSTVAAIASGANTSNYFWDQTIIFQTADSGVSVSRGTNQVLRVTGEATTQFALVQYVDLPTARELLNNRLSVNLSGLTDITGGVAGTISLWHTTDAALPDMTANASIVATLSAAGKPDTFNGTWVEVDRSNLGDATFTLAESTTNNFNDYGFSGWDTLGDSSVTTATFFAIVVGFEAIAAADTIDINSISLVPGDIPSRPAVETADEALAKCERFYEKSYESSVVGGTVTNVGAVIAVQNSGSSDVGNNVNGVRMPFYIPFKNIKRSASSTITFYSNNSGTVSNFYWRTFFGGALNSAANIASSGWTVNYLSTKGVGYIPDGAGPSLPIVTSGTKTTPASTWIEFHYIADARLGIV